MYLDLMTENRLYFVFVFKPPSPYAILEARALEKRLSPQDAYQGIY